MLQTQTPAQVIERAFVLNKVSTISYFRMGNPHYHRRYLVSRSCSGWEGVVPRHYGRREDGGDPRGFEACLVSRHFGSQ